jgi:hypothetical protein
LPATAVQPLPKRMDVPAVATGPAAEVIRAKRFEVVDDSGRPWLVLAKTESAGSLAVLDQAGKLLVTISGTPDGSGLLAIANNEGKRLIELSGKANEGAGVLNVFANDGEVAISLLAAENAGLVQTLIGKKPTVMLGGVKGVGVVATFDEEGKLKDTLPKQ